MPLLNSIEAASTIKCSLHWYLFIVKVVKLQEATTAGIAKVTTR